VLRHPLAAVVNSKATLTGRRVRIGFVCAWVEPCAPFVPMSVDHDFGFVLLAGSH
jgi:hypothetical protein